MLRSKFRGNRTPILDAAELDKICVVRKSSNNNNEIETQVLQLQNITNASVKKIVDEVELKKTFENSDVFFSELVVFVEGFSDELVIKEAIKKLSPELLYRVSVVNCHGNSKFLSMIRFLESFKSKSGSQIKWIVISDKDSLTKDVLKDFKSFPVKQLIVWDKIDLLCRKEIAIDPDHACLNRKSAMLISNNINRSLQYCGVFIMEGDIEFSLVTLTNLNKVMTQIKKFDQKGEATLSRFQGVDKVATLIGSKGPNLNWSLEENNRKKWKRAELHRSIIASCNEEEISDELKRVVGWIKKNLN